MPLNFNMPYTPFLTEIKIIYVINIKAKFLTENSLLLTQINMDIDSPAGRNISSGMVHSSGFLSIE